MIKLQETPNVKTQKKERVASISTKSSQHHDLME